MDTSAELMARLNRDGAALAVRFGLKYRAIEAERPRVKRRYGVCYADGTIRIRLKHAASGKPLKYSSLVNTLCHELAHLRHFNHSTRFRRFYLQILEYARGVRIYQPRAERLPPPTPDLPAPLRVRTKLAGLPEFTPTLAPRRARSSPLQLTLFEVDRG